MAHQEGTTLERQGQLFFTAIDTKLAKVLAEAHDLASDCPEILSRIEADLDAAARRKKALRLLDARYAGEQTLPLPLEALVEAAAKQIEAEELSLQVGRPRTHPMVVCFFLVLRGYFGSVSDHHSWERFADSLTLRAYLEPYASRLPGRTTLLELLNQVSASTRSFILDKQLAQVIGEDLDDLMQQTIDSTAVAANSAWPTEIGLIQGLLERAHRVGRVLDEYEVEPFRMWHTERWFTQLQSAMMAILLGKPRRARQQRKAYRAYIAKADQLLTFLHNEHDAREAAVAQAMLPPSRRLQLQRLWRLLGDALADADTLLNYLSAKSLSDTEVVRDEAEKIFSLSDGSAAFIIKGERDTVFGYKVQVGRSTNGFITAVSVPEGNAADSAQLVPMVEQHLARTGITPALVTADDGYASREAERKLKTDHGISDVSITGAKGRRQLGESLWNSELYAQSRADRSAVESLMFTLKHSFAFGRCRRRGIDAVRAEIMEKAIAYNFWRLAYIREQQAAETEQKRRRRPAA